MDRIPQKLVILVIVGTILIIIFQAIYFGGSVAIDVMGLKVFRLGNKTVQVDVPNGYYFIDSPDSLRNYENDGLIFLMRGDSLHQDISLMWAEIFLMDDMKSLENLSSQIENETEDKILFRRVQGSSLNVIFLVGIEVSDSVFQYSRYLKAFPYFLRLSVTYEGNMGPPESVMDILKSVRVVTQ